MLSNPNSINFTQPKKPIVEISSLNNTRLWLRRDDLTGIELSETKIRELDILLQTAIDEKAHGIITCGGLQSNHCRAAVYVETKLGLIFYWVDIPINDILDRNKPLQ